MYFSKGNDNKQVTISGNIADSRDESLPSILINEI
jgi:hypothetical protein